MEWTLLKSVLEVVSLGVGLTSGLLAALWGYSKFIVERGLLPPVRFWVTCESIGVHDAEHVTQIVVHIENIGTSTLIATDIRLDVRYVREADRLQLFTDARRAGRVKFPQSLRAVAVPLSEAPALPATGRSDAHAEHVEKPQRGIQIVPFDTFVQGGIDQAYTFVTALPADTRFVLVRASFRYAQRPSAFASAVLFISRRLGLVQFALAHVRQPHTTEMAFCVGESAATQLLGRDGL